MTTMSKLWVYVRFQLMMFVFGIVGPIFLIGYFAIQPEPDTRWMFWWGLFITAFDVLLALWLAKGAVENARDDGNLGALRRLGTRGDRT
jgi:hypothetical protein